MTGRDGLDGPLAHFEILRDGLIRQVRLLPWQVEALRRISAAHNLPLHVHTRDGAAPLVTREPVVHHGVHVADTFRDSLGQVVLVDEIRRFGEAAKTAADGLRRTLREAGVLTEEPPADPRARALWLQQNRNTGPARPDAGHRRRTRGNHR